MMKRLLACTFALLFAAPLQAQSPDNSRVPPLTSVTACDGGVFTLGTGSPRIIYRNGVTTQGSGSALLVWKCVLYALGDDANWWQYTGAAGWSWEQLGKTDPAGGPVVAPPVIIPSATNKLAWTMSNTTTTIIAAGSFKLYVDAVPAVTVAGRTCVAAGADVTCTIPLQTLALGPHTLALTWVDAKKVESAKSVPITVIISATLVPANLRLE